MVVLGGGAVSYERGTPVGLRVVGRARAATENPWPALCMLQQESLFIDNFRGAIHRKLSTNKDFWEVPFALMLSPG